MEKIDRVGWCSKNANINSKLLPTIQDELYALLLTQCDLDHQKIPIQIAVKSWDKFSQVCPTLAKFLQFRKISDYFKYIVFNISQNQNLPIHVDSFDSHTQLCELALNIPVRNCDQSATIFYNAVPTNNYTTDFVSDSYPEAARGHIYDSHTANEIDRIDSNVPHWVNITVPHSAMIMHDRLRINSSIRFMPNIVDDILIKL